MNRDETLIEIRKLNKQIHRLSVILITDDLPDHEVKIFNEEIDKLNKKKSKLVDGMTDSRDKKRYG